MHLQIMERHPLGESVSIYKFLQLRVLRALRGVKCRI